MDTIFMKFVKVFIIVFTVIAALIGAMLGVFFILIEPDIKIRGFAELNTDNLTSYSRTINIIDADGKPIADAMYANNMYYVKLEELHPYTAQAFIAIEDKRFYKHSGVDYKRLASAALSNIKSGGFREGASTITQQLIKNTHLSLEKTLKRKLNEIRLARKLERTYSKDEILEGYLNILYFGSGIRGLGTASRVMFGSSAAELSLAQSAALASIINNPAKYSPYNNLDALNARKLLVLKKMRDQGMISSDEYKNAASEPLNFERRTQSRYISSVISEACRTLECSEKALFLQKLVIKTEHNGIISAAARNIVNEYDHNARILVLNNLSGGIVCDESNCYERLEPRRCPASTVKPFISYAPALESGWTPLSFITDEPTDFDGYAPHNYKDIYLGTATLKDCLMRSSNIAAVKLTQTVGMETAKNTAIKFGLRLTDKDNNLPVALGGLSEGATLTELANAYRTLANGGIYSAVGYALNISDNNINRYSLSNKSRRAVGDDTAYLLTDMLRECAKSGTAKKLKNYGHIAAKTGTNGNKDGNSDCYCIAYTPEYTIAVHLYSTNGYIENNITGASCCSAVQRLIDEANIDTNTPFKMPDSVAYYDVDANDLDNKKLRLADPFVPKRYRTRALFSKKHLPRNDRTNTLDLLDRFSWNELS